jgi:hypothetical protein
MKLVTTFAAAAAVCLTLIPQDASAQRRVGVRAVGVGVGVRTVGLRAPVYRPAVRAAAFRTAAYASTGWAGYRYGYRPYWGWGAAAALASTAAYASTGWYPYSNYSYYDDRYSYASYNYPAAYSYASYSYPAAYSYAFYNDPAAYAYASTGYRSCGSSLTWVSTRWGLRRAWVSSCGY